MVSSPVMQEILQEVEGQDRSAEAAFSEEDTTDPNVVVPPGTSMTLDQLRAAAGDQSASADHAKSSAIYSSEVSANRPRPSAESPAQHRSPAVDDPSASTPPGIQDELSEQEALADRQNKVAASGSDDRVELNPNAAPAEASIQDEEAHRAASRAFMDSVAGNVGAAAGPASNEQADWSQHPESTANADFGSSVVSLDDIIADIEQQEAAAGLESSNPASASSQPSPDIHEASAGQLGESAGQEADPGMSRESQASTSYAAASQVSEEAIPGTSAGQSREFQTDTSLQPGQATVNGFEVQVSPGVTGQSQAQDSRQQTSASAQGPLPSSRPADSSSLSSAGDDGATSGQHEMSSRSSPDLSQSREAQAMTSAAAVTRPAEGSAPDASAGQSRELQAEASATGKPAAAASAASESAAAVQQSGLTSDSSQSRDTQASTQSAATSPSAEQSSRSAAQAGSSGSASRMSGRPLRSPFREPAPLPASFRFQDIPPSAASSAAGSPNGNLSQAQDPSSPAGSTSDSQKRDSNSRSRMQDFAARMGTAPGSSPYERRAGFRGRSTSAAGPAASAGQDGADTSSSHRSNAANQATANSEPRIIARREGSNVWDPSQPDFVGFPDHDRVVRGGIALAPPYTDVHIVHMHAAADCRADRQQPYSRCHCNAALHSFP